MVQLRFGEKEQLDLRIRDGDLILGDCRLPALENLFGEIRNGLDSPVDFPAFPQMLAPGDKIVIVLVPGIPKSELLVCSLVQYLIENHVTAEQIQVVVSNVDQSAASRIGEALKQRTINGFSVIEYAGVEKSENAFLGADIDAEPIYVCRAIHEADIVLPIQCVRDSASYQYGGSSGIVPWFVDVATQRRWRATAIGEKGNARTLSDLADDIGKLLGIQLVIGVVPGSNQSVAAIICGDPASVASHGQTLLRNAWPHECTSAVDLIIATIQGGPEHQSWDNIARSIQAVEPVISDRSSVVICSELVAAPGPALMQLASLEDEDRLVKRLLRSDYPDAGIAMVLLDVRQRNRIYLLSNLEREPIEELGIASIASADEIQHLVDASAKCLILESAPFRCVTLLQTPGMDTVSLVTSKTSSTRKRVNR